MAETKIFVKGIKIFKPHEKAPSFVKGGVIIEPNVLHQFLKDNAAFFTEYNGVKQLKCQLLENDKGMYMAVDTYKPTPKAEAPAQSNANTEPSIAEGSQLPF